MTAANLAHWVRLLGSAAPCWPCLRVCVTCQDTCFDNPSDVIYFFPAVIRGVSPRSPSVYQLVMVRPEYLLTQAHDLGHVLLIPLSCRFQHHFSSFPPTEIPEGCCGCQFRSESIFVILNLWVSGQSAGFVVVEVVVVIICDTRDHTQGLRQRDEACTPKS